jgi:dipeptidase
MRTLTIATVTLSAPWVADGCSVFGVGKKATKDGSVIISHSDDGDPSNDARLIYVPAKHHAPGAKRPIFYSGESFPRYVGDARGPGYSPSPETKGYNVSKPIGYIDQVNHTFGFQSSSYGVLNEHGVGVGESTCGAAFGTCARGRTDHCEPGRKIGEALLSIDELSYIAMERCRTSREAVELMGHLALKYGFYGPPDSFEGSGESLMVGDPDEAWAFQILSDPKGVSAIWAAKRVPDTDMTVVANMFTIREVDFNDKDNYILSPNLIDAAKEHGWWKEGEPFDFTKMYSAGEYAHKYYSGRRMWGGFRLAAPSKKLPAEYDDIRYKAAWPWSLKPDQLVTHRDVISWHRDWYAGTPFDQTKGMAAGPFGTPDRFGTTSELKDDNPERTITLYRTNAVYVQHLRHPSKDLPKEIASVAWYGAGPAHYAPFVPVPLGVTQSLGPLSVASPTKYDKKSLNWAVRYIMNICQIRFDRMHKVVEAMQRKIEDAGQELVDKAMSSKDFDAEFERHVEDTLEKWHALATDLIFDFSDNFDMKAMQPLGYPDSWIKQTWNGGPPPAPVEDQCPPKCPHHEHVVV